MSLALESAVNFINFLCKRIKLWDDELFSESLDQQDNVSTKTPYKT